MATSNPPPCPPQPAQATNRNSVHLNPLPPSVFTLPQTAQLEALYTIIRNKETSRGDFLFYSDRIIRLLVEEGLNHLPVVARTVETPTVSSECLKLPRLRTDNSFITGSHLQWLGVRRQNLRCIHSSRWRGMILFGCSWSICSVS